MARKKKIKTKEESKTAVEGDLRFFVNDGRVIQSVGELADTLSEISDETYSYHVNAEKNDFANWVDDVFGHKKLARGLKKVKKKETAVKKVNLHQNIQ